MARVGVQAAEALDHAHRHGVLHRDVKPSNLLLDTRGTLWVTDFGLAKVEGADELTGTGDLIGTLRYMAPERFRGQCDARADVYGLGLTLYELLTLRPAFDDADRARLVARIQHEAPPPPRRLDRRIPRDLETVVLKAIDREPARRYRTAGALADDLKRFLADQPVRARRITWAGRGWRWARRNPGLAAALAGVLALALAVTAVSAVFAVTKARDNEHLTQAFQESSQRYEEKLEAERQRRQFEALSAGLALERGEKLCQQGDLDAGLLWLGRSLQIAPPEDAPLQPPVLVPATITKVTFSPDGTTVLTADNGGSLRLWAADTGRPLGAPLTQVTSTQVAFHPDGRVLAVTPQGVRWWQPPGPAAGSVERLVLSTQVLTGKELDLTGTVRPLTAAEYLDRRRRLDELGGPTLP